MSDHMLEKDLRWLKLDLSGAKTLVAWAEEEGWNPGPHDAEAFYETDPDGFYGYFLHNEMIAGGSVVSYNGQFGFMGFFIVKPEYRSAGIGRQLWYQRRDYLLSRLNKGASIGMDGVVAMQPFYNKGGFNIAFRDERHAIKASSFDVDTRITAIEESDFEQIIAYDSRCFGIERPQFLKPWLQLPGNKSFKFVDQGALKGFVILRKAASGYKICPLFADDAHVAESLLQACLSAVTGETVFLDIPMCHAAAVQLAKKYQGEYVFECARMYYGQPPKMALDQVFGITTFELG